MNENKFDAMGALYSAFRPAYSEKLLDYLMSEAGLSKNSAVADIGSGTGILTKQLLDRGVRVYAVEPNKDMRGAAENDLGTCEGFVSVCGTAERTGLEAGSVDFVVAAQAFHWFDRQRFREECRRILKPGGKIALVWNDRDRESELVLENESINREHCPNFRGFSGGIKGGEEAFQDFFRGPFEIKTFRNDLTYDEAGFVGRSLSASYALKEGEEGYGDYVAALRGLFHRYSGSGALVLPNVTRSYVGAV